MCLIRYVSLIVLITTLAVLPVRAETKELIFAHVGAPGSIYDVSANEFVQRVNKKLPPEYRVVAAGNSRYGGDGAMPAKLKSGEVAFSLLGTVLTSVSPKFGIFELPFLIRDRDQVRQISKALLEPVLQPEAKAAGFRLLAIWEGGFRQFTSNVRPIRKPEDLRGLKIRIPLSPWREKLFRALGAEPVQMEFGKVYEALRSGAIDGQENPLGQIGASKFQEVQRYLALCDYLYSPVYVVVSEEQFSKLPLPVQEIFARTASEMQSWIFAAAIRMESDLVDDIGEKITFTSVDLQAFRRASRPVYGEFARTVPGGARLIAIVGELTSTPSEITAGQ